MRNVDPAAAQNAPDLTAKRPSQYNREPGAPRQESDFLRGKSESRNSKHAPVTIEESAKLKSGQ